MANGVKPILNWGIFLMGLPSVPKSLIFKYQRKFPIILQYSLMYCYGMDMAYKLLLDVKKSSAKSVIFPDGKWPGH